MTMFNCLYMIRMSLCLSTNNYALCFGEHEVCRSVDSKRIYLDNKQHIIFSFFVIVVSLIKINA